MKFYNQYLFGSMLLAGSMAFILTACSDDDTPLSDKRDIRAISIEGVECQSIIDEEQQTIRLVVPEETSDLSLLKGAKLTFTLSDGATAEIRNYGPVNSGDQVDLTKAVCFSAIAPDRSRSDWWIYTTNNDYTLEYGMGSLLTESRSNEASRGTSVYLEQHTSNSYPDNSCGPACAAMACLWAYNRVPASVMTVSFARNFDSSVNWTAETIQRFVSTYAAAGATAQFESLGFSYTDEALADKYTAFLKQKIDEGKILITHTNTGNNTYNGNSSQHTGRYYPNAFSHFILCKGYRVVDGVTYIEAHDPWSEGYTYTDGSYMGENRYYNAAELAKTIADKKIGIVLTIAPK